MTRLRTLCYALSIALWSCGDNDTHRLLVTEGPSTETSGLFARVIDSAGAPVPGVDVRVVAQGTRWNAVVAAGGTPVLARSRTDAEGRVEFRLADTLQVALEIDDSARSGRILSQAGSSTVRDMTTRQGLGLRLRAEAPGEDIRKVYLAGTGYRGIQAQDGSWHFRGLPRGTWSAVAATDSGLALLGRVTLTTRSLDTLLSADSDSVLVEDFGAPLVQNRYGSLLGGSWWFTATDENEGGASYTTPSEVRQARVPCEDGFCLSMDFSLDPNRVGSYALVGTGFGQSFSTGDTLPLLADFSRVRAVRFLASGTGSLLFQVVARSASGTPTNCLAYVSLPATLSEVEVPMAALSCPDPDIDYRAVDGMTWTFTTDGQLTLGRIRLIGAGPRQVFPQLKAP